LASLQAQGTRVIVVTARTRPAGAALSLQAAGLRELIDELVVVDPRAAVAEKARALRRSEAVAFVGDSESDGAAAATAAVPFAAVATGQRSRRMLQAGGWPVYDSLRAALRSLGELGPAR
jgi:phosphoglycolate phosphatase-like HAD superfamily hydrolase